MDQYRYLTLRNPEAVIQEINLGNDGLDAFCADQRGKFEDPDKELKPLFPYLSYLKKIPVSLNMFRKMKDVMTSEGS